MKKIVCLILSILLCVTLVSATGEKLNISDIETETGAEFEIGLSMGVLPVAMGSVVLSYDKSAIEITGYSFKNEFKALSPMMNLNYGDNSIKFNWMSLKESIDFTDFLTLNGKAKKSGEYQIKAETIELYDINENAVEIEFDGGLVKIAGEDIEEEIVTKPSSGGGGGGTSEKETADKTEKEEEPQKEETIVENPTDKVPLKRVNFTDISSVKWAENAILSLGEKGIISGIAEDKFAPYNSIKRCDYVCMLVRMLDLEEVTVFGFSDVSENKYYFKEITTAKAHGLISGSGNNCFEPEIDINRESMFVLVYRILKNKGVLGSDTSVNTINFKDADLIADYAEEAISILSVNGVISGSDGYIMPKKNATRAEAAVLINNLYNLINDGV